MRHLKDLYVRFGDWHLAFAAYNCGAGCVSRAIRRSKMSNPNFWDLVTYLPKETKYYVPWYIATSMIAMNPEAYGFNLDSVEFQEEYKYDVFKLHEPVNITALAKCAGITVEELLELNPELIKATTPPDLPEYELKIPANTYSQFAVNYDSLTIQDKQPWFEHIVQKRESLRTLATKYKVSRYDIALLNNIEPRARLKRNDVIKIPISQEVDIEELAAATGVSEGSEDIYHVVKRGETLSSIARKHGVRITALRNLNNISYSNDKIHPGQKLVIAKAPAKRQTAKQNDNSDLAAKTAPKVKNPPAANKQQDLASAGADDEDEEELAEEEEETEEEVSAPAQKRTKVEKIQQPVIVKHTVKKGESLFSISQLYDVPVEVITQDNRIRNDHIYPEQILKIRTNAGDVASNKAKVEAAKPQMIVHKVKNGQSLGLIAQRYGVKESQIKQWNPDQVSGNTIFAGSKLKIYPDETYKGSTKSNSTPVYYTVRKNDTLAKIARKYGVSVNHLEKMNKNLNPTRMQVGDKIRIQ
jgi:membrane-bound lytic murein transglycosylase D